MQGDITVVGENSFRLGMCRKSAERPKEAKHPRKCQMNASTHSQVGQ
jgi:hypothetical protein